MPQAVLANLHQQFVSMARQAAANAPDGDCVWESLIEAGLELLTHPLPATMEASVCRWVSLAYEKTGRWQALADVAGRGVAAAERGRGRVDEEDYISCMLSYGRGLYEQLRYEEALSVYRRLQTYVKGRPRYRWVDVVARFTVASCLVKINPHDVREAEQEFRRLIVDPATSWRYRLAAGANLSELLAETGRLHEAKDLLFDLYLRCPNSERRGSPWGMMLSVMGQLLAEEKPGVALELVTEALEATPPTRHVTLAKAHAVRALVCVHLGELEEVKEAVELAEQYYAKAPSARVSRIIEKVYQFLSQGGD